MVKLQYLKNPNQQKPQQDLLKDISLCNQNKHHLLWLLEQNLKQYNQYLQQNLLQLLKQNLHKTKPIIWTYFGDKEIKQNWTGLETFDMSFSFHVDCYCQSFVSGLKLSPPKFDIFLFFNFLRLQVLKHLVHQISSPVLHELNLY